MPLNGQKKLLSLLSVCALLYLSVHYWHHQRGHLSLKYLVVFLLMAAGTLLFWGLGRLRTRTVFLVVVMAILILNFTCFKFENLSARQTNQMMTEEDEALNKFLYRYEQEHGWAVNIVGEYKTLFFIPELRDHYIGQRITPDLIKGLPLRHDVGCLLMPVESDDPVRKQAGGMILERLKTGVYQVLFKGNQYWLIKTGR